jgi:signal transduction histidine kinase
MEAEPVVGRDTVRVRRLLDVGVAALATAAEFVLLLDDGHASVMALALTAASGLVLLVRRSAPLAVLSATVGAALVIVAGGEAPAGACVLLALYTVGAECERRPSLVALATAATVLVAVSVAAARHDGAGVALTAVDALGALLLNSGVWALGAYVQTRRRYVAALEERTLRLEREREQLARIAVHEECSAIARELHDIIAHSVAVMLLGVRGARDAMTRSPAAAGDALERVEGIAEESLGDLRRSLALLRAPTERAETRPPPAMTDLDALVAGFRDLGLRVVLDVTGDRPATSPGTELAVYRIVQEALTNALRHAGPVRVAVRIAFSPSGLELEIADDGAGAPANPSRPGHGIVGMRERAVLLGGELEAGCRPGGGFRVAARVPLEAGR